LSGLCPPPPQTRRAGHPRGAAGQADVPSLLLARAGWYSTAFIFHEKYLKCSRARADARSSPAPYATSPVCDGVQPLHHLSLRRGLGPSPCTLPPCRDAFFSSSSSLCHGEQSLWCLGWGHSGEHLPPRAPPPPSFRPLLR